MGRAQCVTEQFLYYRWFAGIAQLYAMSGYTG